MYCILIDAHLSDGDRLATLDMFPLMGIDLFKVSTRPKKNYREVLPRLAKLYHDLESLAMSCQEVMKSSCSLKHIQMRHNYSSIVFKHVWLPN